MKKYETFEEVVQRLLKERGINVTIAEIYSHNFNNTHEAVDFFRIIKGDKTYGKKD